MSENEQEYKQEILTHLATAPVKKALARFGVATGTSTKAAKAVPAWLTGLFTTVVLPVLPALLSLAGAKITGNEKLRKILTAVRDVCIGLVGPA